MTGIKARLAKIFCAALCVIFILLQSGEAFAQQVTPSQRVVTGVIIRSQPSTQSSPLGALRPGERAEIIGTQPLWYHVRLPDGRTGFVSRGWVVLATAAVGEFRIHVIDVGTGLAIFVEGPQLTLLYDAGSNDDLARGARNRVLAYLRRVRPDLRVIDHVILSHAHRDHIALLPDIFDAYEVRNVWDSGRLYDSCGYRDFLLKVVSERSAFHTAVGAGERHAFQFANCRNGPSTVEVQLGSSMTHEPVALAPGALMTILQIDAQSYEDANENSVVVRMDVGPRRILFMGDAEGGQRRPPSSPPDAGSVEAQLLICCRQAVAADVLIAGHHGSMTSSRTAFLDAVHAADFVISAGPTRYSGTQLPDQVIVQELERRGRLWRTDRDDTGCATRPNKIGPDSDRRPGGCDNVLIRILPTGQVQTSYTQLSD